MVSRTQIDHANPQAVLGVIDTWKNAAKDMVSHGDTYRQAVTSPGGQPWSGQTRDAAVQMAGKDCTAIERIRESIDGMADVAANGVNFTVIPALSEVRCEIASAEANGFQVNDDLSVTDTEDDDDDDDDAPDPKRTQAREIYEQNIKKLAKVWWDADQAVATQIDNDKKNVVAQFSHGHIPETPEQAEHDVQAALGGDKGAAGRVNSVLDTITDDQKAGKAPLTPAQASVLSQLQAQQNGMSKNDLNYTEKKLGDQSRMVPNSWQLMSNDKLSYPKTPLTVGAKQGSETVKGGFGQLPGSIQEAYKSEHGGEERAHTSWHWTGTDFAQTSATAIKGGVNDAVGKAVLASPDTGAGKPGPGLVKWFEEPALKGFSRSNVVTAAVMAVPAAINDHYGEDHNSWAEAITREAGGAGFGILAGAEMGGLIGTAIPIPVVGTAVGVVAGAVIGGVASTEMSKVIGHAWESIFD